MQPGAPIVHDEPDAIKGSTTRAATWSTTSCALRRCRGWLCRGRLRLRGRVPHAPGAAGHIEPHVCITWWDEDDRLVVRTSTQVPFHIRRMVAPLVGLPMRRIRVIKPRIGGGFGGKQEMLLEDLCAHLTIATGRPVRMEYTPRAGVHQLAQPPSGDPAL
jgi:putative selenate reductase molybdopterin-binding subunit